MRNKFAKLGGIGVSAVLAAAALVIVPAVAASATTGSAHDLFLTSLEDGTQIPAGSSLGWNDDTSASPDPSDEDFNSFFAVPAGTATVKTFIAPRGQETNQSAWNAYGPLGNTPSGIVLPNLKPSGNTSAGLGTPSGSGAVGNAGGQYSLGIAFIDNTGNNVIEADFTFITVTGNANANLATWTFDTPVVTSAPVITTTALNALTQNAAFTQTIAATGTAPITWAVQTGTLPAGLSLNATTGAISGTPTAAGAYSFTLRATNGVGFDDQAFTGTVAAPAPTAPTEPTGSDAHKVVIANPAEGVTTITVPAGVANANKTVKAWGWSDPTNLGQSTASAAGDVTVDISTLAPGTHTIALTEAGDATFTVVAWGTVEIPVPTYPAKTDTVNLNAAVTASDLWSLNAEQTVVDFGNVQRDQSATRALGKVTVVDDRNVLKGWNLDAGWTAFTAGADVIPTSALTITPKAFTGYTLIPGITLGATANKIAQSDANISTLAAGALFDADLTFKAPKDAKVGQYHSTLTLTLASK